MTLKEFLKDHPMINKAQLAKAMWPNVKNPRFKLQNKLLENVAGTGKQRITQKDVDLAKSVLSQLFKDADRIEV